MQFRGTAGAMSRKTLYSIPGSLVPVLNFRKLSSIYVFSYFPFGFEGRIWDLIVSVPDHCLSFYFTNDTLYWQKHVHYKVLVNRYGDLSMNTVRRFTDRFDMKSVN